MSSQLTHKHKCQLHFKKKKSKDKDDSGKMVQTVVYAVKMGTKKEKT